MADVSGVPQDDCSGFERSAATSELESMLRLYSLVARAGRPGIYQDMVAARITPLPHASVVETCAAQKAVASQSCNLSVGGPLGDASSRKVEEEPEAAGSDTDLESLHPLSVASLAAAGKKKDKKEPEQKGGGKKSGKNSMSRSTKISKSMTQTLRHSAKTMGVAIRADGYVLVDDLLATGSVKKEQGTEEDIKEIVRDSDKQRFQLAERDGRLWVRAVQGHSMPGIKDDLILRRLEANCQATDGDLPGEVLHGTYLRHWESIQASGLLAGGKQGKKFRKHVHFAPGLPKEGGVVSGMRESCDLVVYLDVQNALTAGLPLLRSNNNVYLSPGFDGAVPFRLLTRAVKLADMSVIWQAE
eukprot:TRINITY_DN122751_c0_g1_i1.p1 TRINITY_DN122751_c0_g1~~TRINITY_DN122751_c0_g1_i1.p1  ORF type:complete len:358 (-),score=94.31 TRINITY_DN122751_c0_g1_i1:275-1348(-)